MPADDTASTSTADSRHQVFTLDETRHRQAVPAALRNNPNPAISRRDPKEDQDV
jgi:hypothetical protein